MGLANIYGFSLACIAVVLFTIGVVRARGVKTTADFIVAGRRLPAYVLVATLLCSWIGAGSLFAGAEAAVRYGFSALWQPAGGWVALLIIFFVAPRARKFAQYTLPDLLEIRYNATARVLGTIAIVFSYTAMVSYQFKGGGDILHLATGIDNTTGMYIIAAFAIVFTALAGLSSIAYMDVVIGILVTITTVIGAGVLLHGIGGWAGVRAALPPEHFMVLGHMSVTRAMELFIPAFLLMLGNQVMYQKFFAAKSEKDAKVAVTGWIVGTVVLETIILSIAVIGSAMFFSNPELASKPREVIPYVARHAMPRLLGAVLLGAIFAKVLSAATSCLFSPATNLVNDIYTRFINKDASSKQVIGLSRVLVLLLGLFALAQGAYWTSVLAMALYAYTIYSAAITPVVMAAFFWKRATAAGAVSSIALGTLVTLAWNYGARNLFGPYWSQRDAVWPAMAASITSLVVVSLLTRAPSPQRIAQFFPETEPLQDVVSVLSD